MSRLCRKSAKRGRKRGCIPARKTRRWTSATRPREIVHLGGLRVTYRETPGHAEDGVTYIIGNWQEDAPHVAIVGDAIFAGSIGRGNQSWDLARQKVREQIFIAAGGDA